eukprot:767083-Hanusia_phi.AAC.7
MKASSLSLFFTVFSWAASDAVYTQHKPTTIPHERSLSLSACPRHACCQMAPRQNPSPLRLAGGTEKKFNHTEGQQIQEAEHEDGGDGGDVSPSSHNNQEAKRKVRRERRASDRLREGSDSDSDSDEDEGWQDGQNEGSSTGAQESNARIGFGDEDEAMAARKKKMKREVNAAADKRQGVKAFSPEIAGLSSCHQTGL